METTFAISDGLANLWNGLVLNLPVIILGAIVWYLMRSKKAGNVRGTKIAYILLALFIIVVVGFALLIAITVGR